MGGDMAGGVIKLGLRYYLNEPRPRKPLLFLSGGLGLYTFKIDDIMLEDFSNQYEQQKGNMLNVGFGFTWPTNIVDIYLHARYETLYTNGDENVMYYPITFGVIF